MREHNAKIKRMIKELDKFQEVIAIDNFNESIFVCDYKGFCAYEGDDEKYRNCARENKLCGYLLLISGKEEE